MIFSLKEVPEMSEGTEDGATSTEVMQGTEVGGGTVQTSYGGTEKRS
jgi:hypothetical protein